MTAAAARDRLRVLLLEDEGVNRSLVRAVLSRAPDEALRSATLVEATTIEEARAHLAAQSVDVALLDVRVPDGNGLDLARELAGGPPGTRPAIVVVSASVMGPERDAAIASGCDAFLAKPYRPAELIETLRRVLANGASGVA